MKLNIVIAVGALTLAACSDGLEPTAVDPSHTILVDGNVSECGTIDFTSCFAKLDMQFKLMYEWNNSYSRTGEAFYNDASNSNYELATIFNAPERSVAEAIRALDRFIAQIENALRAGDYSTCAADGLLAHATWLRAKLVAGSVDLSDAPPLGWCISPVTVTATGSITNGVTLTINDPFHFTQGSDPVDVYFDITLPGGTVVVFDVGEQFGPTTVTYQDPATIAPGTYTYLVRQCDAIGYIGCSAWAEVTVTIAEGSTGTGTCPHDNRNGLKDTVDKTKPKCEKDDKQPKIHG